MLKSANFCNKINKKKKLKWCCEGWRYVAKLRSCKVVENNNVD